MEWKKSRETADEVRRKRDRYINEALEMARKAAHTPEITEPKPAPKKTDSAKGAKVLHAAGAAALDIAKEAARDAGEILAGNLKQEAEALTGKIAAGAVDGAVKLAEGAVESVREHARR